MVTKSNGNRKRKTGKEANAGGKMWIPISDRELVREEGLGLQDYWLDCWQTDPFGNRWTLMASGDEAIAELKSTTKAKYRKLLTQMGLFAFKEIKDRSNRSLWLQNLHGSKVKSKKEYQEFLDSEYWQEVRKLVLERDCYTCQHCGVTQNLNVHHLTYEHHGEEHLHLDDLVTLCRSCHAAEHGLKY